MSSILKEFSLSSASHSSIASSFWIFQIQTRNVSIVFFREEGGLLHAMPALPFSPSLGGMGFMQASPTVTPALETACSCLPVLSPVPACLLPPPPVPLHAMEGMARGQKI